MSALLTESEVFPWAERVLGARIVCARRQGGRESGGRPGWFVDVDGGRRFYIRGDRGGDFGFTREYGLQRETRVLRLLREEGIPVPEVIATSEYPNAAILEFIPGVNDFTTLASPAERDAVARDFAGVMARWHAIPAQKFVEIGRGRRAVVHCRFPFVAADKPAASRFMSCHPPPIALYS